MIPSCYVIILMSGRGIQVWRSVLIRIGKDFTTSVPVLGRETGDVIFNLSLRPRAKGIQHVKRVWAHTLLNDIK